MSADNKLLDSLSIVDLSPGFLAALAARLLAEAGAKIRRIMPAAGDSFYALYPAYAVWRRRAAISNAETLPAAIALASGIGSRIVKS
jgi:crotonobetainyl-CoA:carnitine CoA-transferase CaiB-like acyl-CoA transferase